ncbi:MAG: endo-beta-N-acetylglucosaminidase [Prevotella sp.]|jgi:endo-beta-N-acetylglucosaminidase D
MKKRITLSTLLVALLLIGGSASVHAQKYNFEKFSWLKLVDVFATALEEGKNYPTDQEIANAMGMTTTDLAFIKSHVKIRERIGDDRRLIPETKEGRKMWLNFPMGSGKGGDAGYPTGVWHSDVFSLWNYTNLYGGWNHSIGQVPGAWIDAAHKNGCNMLGGTCFFDSGAAGGYAQWTSFASAKSSNSNVSYDGFRNVKPTIHMLLYFGMDGININWEVGEYSMGNYKKFHQALYKYAHEIGFDNFHLGIYTTATFLSFNLATNRYADENGQISDFMLNYGGEYNAGESVQAAQGANSTLGASRLYQGFWIVGMNHGWTNMSETKDMNICLWGEHDNTRFWSYNSGAGTMEQQDNYQRFLERAFSGGNLNPLNRPTVSNSGNNMEWTGNIPPLSTFAGFSEWIPERSTVKGKFPFYTNFNLGNGDRYNYRGKKSSGAWYNMAAQDVVPTYRWLVLQGGQKVSKDATLSNDIEVAFSHNDAFNGGSCLELKGDASKQTDVVLYKTDITPNDGGAYALVAIKGAGERNDEAIPSNLSLILEVNGSWKEYKVPDNAGKTWEEHRIELGLSSSDVITHIGLRVQGGNNNYHMYVGELQLNDGHKVAPKSVSNLNVEKTDETKATMDLKLNWDVDAVADEYGRVLNEDAGIDHFEILFKDGENGKISEVGRTTQWATFIPALGVENAENPYIGVVAVSKDLKTMSEPVWQAVEKSQNLEEDPFGTYGQCSLDKNANGFEAATKLRGVEKFQTSGNPEGDITYTRTYAEFQADNNGGKAAYLNYHHAENLTLKVRQGTTFDFNLKGFNGEEINGGASKDDCRYCFVGGWIDFDGSGTFNYGLGPVEQMLWLPQYDGRTDQENFQFDQGSADGTDPMGERVFRAGSLRKGNPCLVKGDGLKGTITIPADAHLGKSRLRIVYSDAWFAGQFSPTTNHNKGYALDIDVEIVGDNVDGQRGPKDFHDAGEPDDWTVITDIKDVNKVSTEEASVKVVDGRLVFENTLKAEIFNTNGMLMKSISRPHVVYGRNLVKGVYIIRLNGKKTVKVII